MSRALWLSQLSPPPPVLPLTPDRPVYPFWHCSKKACSLLAPQLSCRGSYEHLQGPEERAEFVQDMQGDAGSYCSPISPFGREIPQQFSVTTWLYMRCLPSKSRDTMPHHQQEVLQWKVTTTQTMPLVIRLPGMSQWIPDLFYEKKKLSG